MKEPMFTICKVFQGWRAPYEVQQELSQTEEVSNGYIDWLITCPKTSLGQVYPKTEQWLIDNGGVAGEAIIILI